MKKLLALFILPLLVAGSLSPVFTPSASAVTAADWKAGRIIDDANFTGLDMSVADIQNFLNSKVPVCDTWGTQPASEYGRNDLTHAQYAASGGWPAPPSVCLKNYHEVPKTAPGPGVPANSYTNGGNPPAGSVSAAQMIYNAAKTHRISPKVLLVKLDTESAGPLTRDKWPLPTQYTYAMGAHCPDSGPGGAANCDPNYAGFSIQIAEAAELLRWYLDGMTQSWWQYKKPFQNNNVLWQNARGSFYNPSGTLQSQGCGYNITYIETMGTAALYTYTPYQPNQAALNNMYGTGDACSAYGNRNFWRVYNDWFASTLVYDPYGWQVIRTADDSREYLKIGNTKRWIPSGELASDWNLSIKPIETVSQSYLDSIPTLPPLDRLGLYNNKYFYVSGGKKYWLSNDALLKAWGQYDKKAIAAPAYIPLSTIADGGEATFYISYGSNNVGRLVNGQLFAINPGDADRWQANPTAVTTAAYSSFPIAGNVTYKLLVNGIKYIVDEGKLLNVNDSSLQRDFNSAGSYVSFPEEIIKFLTPRSVASLVQVRNTNEWYILRNGTLYYVPKASIAASWGYRDQPDVISPRLGNDYAKSPVVLSAIVKNQSGIFSILDGKRHTLEGVASQAIQSTENLAPVFDDAIINTVADGGPISTPLIVTKERGDVFAIMNGGIHYIPSQAVLNAFGYPRKYSMASVGKAFVDSQIIKGTANQFIQNSNISYFLQDGNIFAISDTARNDWLGGQQATAFTNTDDLGNYFDIVSTTPLTQFVQQGSARYILSNGVAYEASDAYFSNRSWQPLALFGIPIGERLSYLVRSTDNADSRIWLIVGNTKHHIINGDAYSSYSKGSTVKVSRMSPALLSEFSQVNLGVNPSPLLHLEGAGFKLLNESGQYMGFADGATAISFASNSVKSVSKEIYNSYSSSNQTVSRLIRDPSGKIYYIEAGKKRWITNGSAYSRYQHLPLSSVGWNIVDWLPNGPQID